MILKYYTYIANYYKLNHSEGLLAVGQHPYSLKALAVDHVEEVMITLSQVHGMHVM